MKQTTVELPAAPSELDRPSAPARTASAEPSAVGEDARVAKSFAALFSIALMIGILMPIVQNWREQPKDDFPFSYYPMFSKPRAGDYRQAHFVGLDAEGNEYHLPHKFGGDGGLNQTRRQLSRVLRENKPADVDAFCQNLARRVAKSNVAPFDSIVEVRLVIGTFRLDDYFAHGKKAPLSQEVRASCRVEEKQ